MCLTRLQLSTDWTSIKRLLHPDQCLIELQSVVNTHIQMANADASHEEYFTNNKGHGRKELLKMRPSVSVHPGFPKHTSTKDGVTDD